MDLAPSPRSAGATVERRACGLEPPRRAPILPVCRARPIRPKKLASLAGARLEPGGKPMGFRQFFR
jgi:hypothetical protein